MVERWNWEMLGEEWFIKREERKRRDATVRGVEMQVAEGRSVGLGETALCHVLL